MKHVLPFALLLLIALSACKSTKKAYEQGDYEMAISILEKGLEECPDNAEMYYRGVVYLIGSGSYKNAINRLETALMLDFEGHEVLFDFFPNLPTQKALYRIIDQFRKDNQ